MTRQEFENRYIRIYLKYIDSECKNRNSLKGKLKQMDVQRYFNDYEIRDKGVDCVWNDITLEVKTGYRFEIERNGKTIEGDFVVWTPSKTIGSITDWRVYDKDEFVECVKPFCQKTWSGNKKTEVLKLQDGCQKSLGRVLEEIKFSYLDNFMKEYEK